MQIPASILCALVVACLFFLDRDTDARVSKALWIPTIWVLIIGSRPITSWLQMQPTGSLVEQYSEGSPVDAAFYGVLILAGLLVLNRRSRAIRSLLRENGPLLLFFLFCALSILWSDHPFVALKRWIKATGDLVMVLVVLSDSRPDAAVKRLLSRVAFILLPMSVLFILFYPKLGSSYNPADRITMYFGVTTFKNMLGMTCLICGLGSLWSLIGAFESTTMQYKTRHMMANGAVLVMAVWLIVTADSMTSLACLLLGAAIMVICAQRWVEERPDHLHAIVGSTVGIAFFAVFIQTAGTLLHILGRNTTLTGRIAIWKAVLSLHTNPLIGTGFESFWLGNRLESIWVLNEKGIQEAHNGYIEVYLNLGWAGVILLMVLFFTGYRHLFEIYRRHPHAGLLKVSFFAVCAMYSMTEAGFRMMSIIWFAFLLAIAGVPELPRMRSKQLSNALPLTEVAKHGAMRILR